MSATDNKVTVERINEAMARADVEGFLAYCTEDFVWTMVGEAPVQGKDAIRKWMAQMPQDPPDFTVRTLVGDGDYVIARGDMEMPEENGVNTYEFCDVWRFAGDRAVELNAFVIKTKAADKAQTAERTMSASSSR
jgi:ketosteroid isomerase-like protein